MSSGAISWPCGDEPFSKTVRGRFYRRRLRRERLACLGLVVVPCITWALRMPPEGSWPELPWLLAMSALFAGTWWAGRRVLTRHLAEALRRGDRETQAWRSAFADVVARTAALAGAASATDRARDRFLRAKAFAAVSANLNYVYSLSAPVDISFSPRHLASGPAHAEKVRETLEGQLVLELLRTGVITAIFRDQGGNLVSLAQLDGIAQFWAIIRVEHFGSEVRVSERTGYQWWIPWNSRTRKLGLPMRRKLARVDSALTDGFGAWWPFSSYVSKSVRLGIASAFALVFFPIGLAVWASRVFLSARDLKRFKAWHDPSAGDSLDVALLGNERRIRLSAYLDWQLESMEKEDGTPSFPDVMGRIDVLRELVGAAVSQAIEEAINSSTTDRQWRQVAS